MNTDVHEYVSKSKHLCTVYLYHLKGAGNSIVAYRHFAVFYL